MLILQHFCPPLLMWTGDATVLAGGSRWLTPGHLSPRREKGAAMSSSTQCARIFKELTYLTDPSLLGDRCVVFTFYFKYLLMYFLNTKSIHMVQIQTLKNLNEE